jgi:hypothetical protein
MGSRRRLSNDSFDRVMGFVNDMDHAAYVAFIDYHINGIGNGSLWLTQSQQMVYAQEILKHAEIGEPALRTAGDSCS